MGQVIFWVVLGTIVTLMVVRIFRRARAESKIAKRKREAEDLLLKGHAAEALASTEPCIALARDVCGEDSTPYICALADAGRIYQKTGATAAAEAHYLRAISLFRRLIMAEGEPLHSGWVDWLRKTTRGLSSLYAEMGRDNAHRELQQRLTSLSLLVAQGPQLSKGCLRGFPLFSLLRRTFARALPPRRKLSSHSDVVDCSVFARPYVAPGETLFVQVFALLPEQTDVADARAREFDDRAQRRGSTTLECLVQRGTQLAFHLSVPGLVVDEPVQTLIWRGNPQSVQYAVTVPGDASPGDLVGTVSVSQNSVPFGHVKFKITVSPEPPRAAPIADEPVGVSARRYEKAFVSYATSDRNEVVKRLQMLRPLGIKFFQDLLSIEPGEQWEKKLYAYIDESDLFLLFWSSAARESEWVLRELRHALARKGGNDPLPPEIMPIILEGPPPPEPPAELSHLHFNDFLLYLKSRSPEGGPNNRVQATR